MLFSESFAYLILSASVVSAAAVPTSGHPEFKRAATCTFTNAASATASKTSCPTLILDNVAVPAGKTLDLTGLKSGTHVRPFCKHHYNFTPSLTAHQCRSSSKARPPSAIQSGPVPSFLFLVHPSQSLAHLVLSLMPKVPAGGIVKVVTEERRSQSSSTRTT